MFEFRLAALDFMVRFLDAQIGEHRMSHAVRRKFESLLRKFSHLRPIQ
jgi:hypothetical protein